MPVLAEEEQADEEQALIEEYARKGSNVAAMQIPEAAKDLSASALGGTFLVGVSTILVIGVLLMSVLAAGRQ
jgi:hypothetical protein